MDKSFKKIANYISKEINFGDTYKISRSLDRNRFIRDVSCENLSFLRRFNKATFIEDAIF